MTCKAYLFDLKYRVSGSHTDCIFPCELCLTLQASGKQTVVFVSVFIYKMKIKLKMVLCVLLLFWHSLGVDLTGMLMESS